LISKAEVYSSLPWYRRCLADTESSPKELLNWRPVVDYELRAIEYENRTIAHEQRMKQLQNEEHLRIATEQLKTETQQLRKETELMGTSNNRNLPAIRGH